MSDKKADLTHPGKHQVLLNMLARESHDTFGIYSITFFPSMLRYKTLAFSFIMRTVGYNPGEQHLGKSKVDSHEDGLAPQAGTHGQSSSHISGQTGPEILGGKFYFLEQEKLHTRIFVFKGSASARVVGQSVDEQLKNPLPSKGSQ